MTDKSSTIFNHKNIAAERETTSFDFDCQFVLSDYIVLVSLMLGIWIFYKQLVI